MLIAEQLYNVKRTYYIFDTPSLHLCLLPEIFGKLLLAVCDLQILLNTSAFMRIYIHIMIKF